MGQATTSPDTVAAELGLDGSFRPWLDALAAAGGAPLEPPVGGVGDVLRRLGVSEASVVEAEATFPDPGRDPARWWLVEQGCRWVAATRGDVGADVPRWPTLPDHAGSVGRCYPLHLFAAAAPALRAWHDGRGIPADVSWATIADLGRHEAIHRRTTGTAGVDAPWWLVGHLRGVLVEVGALQYAPYRVGGPGSPEPWDAGASTLGPGFRPGDASVGVHIPAGALLAADAVDASEARAARVLDTSFPAAHRRVLTCSSWLLDPTLADLLHAGSRIVGFQRRYRLLPGAVDARDAVLSFAFRHRGLPPTTEAARTRLQRAVLAHLAGGGRFEWRTGWRPWPAPDA